MTARIRSMDVWIRRYEPFALGAPLDRVYMAHVPVVEGPYGLTGGYEGCLIKTPSGRSFVAEVTTGGVVGDSLAQVAKDIWKGDPVVMAKQIDDAMQTRGRAVRVDLDEFWTMLDKLPALS